MNSEMQIILQNPKNEEKEINVGQLITLSLHNQGLKDVIENIMRKIKMQEKHNIKIQKKLQQLEKTSALTNFQMNRVDEDRKLKEASINQQFAKIQQIQKQLFKSIEENHSFTKKQIQNINIVKFRDDMRDLIQTSQKRYQQTLQLKIQDIVQKFQNSLQTLNRENTIKYQKLGQQNTSISNQILAQTNSLCEFRQKIHLHLQKQQLQISNSKRDFDTQRNKIDNTLSCLKQDILESVPKLLYSMLQDNSQEQSQQLKKSIQQQEQSRTKYELQLANKIQNIEIKQAKLEQMFRQLQIQIVVIANNLATKSDIMSLDRRSSRSSARMSICYAKKMSFDVMIQKILLFQQQFVGMGKQNQNLKQKINLLETELQSNPLLSDISSNVHIKRLLEDLLQKNIRCIQNKLVSKLDSDKYQRDLKHLRERFDVMSLSVIDKCEKSQIKKAFQFLQQKLKQVIALVGIKQPHERDPFIQKKLVKCLSCDKEVDKSKDMAKTVATEYQAWKRILTKQNNTQRVNQLGLSSNSIRKLVKTAKLTERAKLHS